MLKSKLHLIIIVAPQRLYSEEATWVWDSKYVVVLDRLSTGHVTQSMRNGHFGLYKGVNSVQFSSVQYEYFYSAIKQDVALRPGTEQKFN